MIKDLENAWPLKDVMKRLVDAAEYLLDKKNYDGSDYEEIGICVKRAKEILAELPEVKGWKEALENYVRGRYPIDESYTKAGEDVQILKRQAAFNAAEWAKKFLAAQQAPAPIVDGGEVYRWVKASERLPENAGQEHEVIIRDINKHLVAYGFKNFDKENPEMYYEVGSKSFLSNGNIEWLEAAPIAPVKECYVPCAWDNESKKSEGEDFLLHANIPVKKVSHVTDWELEAYTKQDVINAWNSASGGDSFLSGEDYVASIKKTIIKG